MDWGTLLGQLIPAAGGLLTTLLSRQEKAGRQVPGGYEAAPLYPGAWEWMEPQLSQLLEPMAFMTPQDVEALRAFAGEAPMEEVTEEALKRGITEAYGGLPEEMAGLAAREFARAAPPSQVRAGLYGEHATDAITRAMAPLLGQRAQALTMAPEMARRLQLGGHGATLQGLLGAGQLATAADKLALQEQMNQLAGLKTGMEARRIHPMRYEASEKPESWFGSLLAGIGGQKGLWPGLSEMFKTWGTSPYENVGEGLSPSVRSGKWFEGGY